MEAKLICTMNARRKKTLWLIIAGTVLSLCMSSALAQQRPDAASQGTARGAEEFDPMDSLLEFSATPSDQLPPPPETNALQLVILESAQLRDPFWPVGYTPAPQQPVVTAVVEVVEEKIEVEPQWDEALRAVSVKGIMNVGGGRFMAVVNNDVVGENDTVSIVYNDRRYSWRVNSITAQGVRFQKMTSSQ